MAIRRLERLEARSREYKGCELWVLFEDGRVQKLGSNEIRRRHELSDLDGVSRLFISEADARL
jgi:hypothetical protein